MKLYRYMKLKKLSVLPISVLSVIIIFCSGCSGVCGHDAEVISLQGLEPGTVGISTFTTGMETIRLETSKDCMIGNIGSIKVDSRNIYIMDMLYRGIHIFRRSDGEYIGGFKRQGRGHGEYIDISDFRVDFEANTLEVLDGGTKRLLIYALDTFDYISEMDLPLLAGKFEKAVDEGIYYFDTRHFTNSVNGEKTNSGVIAFDPSDMSCETLFDYVMKENMSFNIRGFSVNGTGQIYYSQMWDNTFYRIADKKALPVLTVDPGRKGIPEKIRKGTYSEQEKFMQEKRPGYMSFRLSYYDGEMCIVALADRGEVLFYIKDGDSELLAEKISVDYIEGAPCIDAVNLLVLEDTVLVVWFPGEARSPEAEAFLKRMGVMPEDNPVITLFSLG